MNSIGGPTATGIDSATTSADAPVLGDDMQERPERWPLLASRLEECRQTAQPVYGKADAAALSHQRKHQRLTKIAAVSGTIAVVLVILELPWVFGREHTITGFISEVEVFAALAALVAVILGLFASQMNSWLVERHKAERCRLLKFAFLIDPAAWGKHEEKARERVQQLRDQVVAIDAIRTIEEPEKWLAQVHRPAFLAELENYQGDEQVLRQLIGYYQETRLRSQIAYFNDRIQHYALPDRLTRLLPQWLFFISVVAAFVHFAVEFLTREIHSEAALLVALVAALVAATLPVLGAGMRTYRTANEFGRNVKRFESASHVLTEMDRWLEEATDAKAIFLALWGCEHTLEIEHREWLRLMAETEWFG